MSKVFRSIAPGSSATVEFVGADGNVTMYVRQNIGAVDLSSAEAPAIAIAILEAAGLVRDSCSGDDAEVALEWLHSAAARQGREVKEAADREALEGEAFALYSTKTDRVQAYPTVKDMESGPLEFWVAIAKTARELHGGTK